MILQGKNIYLTPIEHSDTPDVVRWRNETFVKERFIYRGPFTAEGHERWLETMVATGKVEQFIIHLQETDRAVGSVYLRDIDYGMAKAEFGIFIGEEDCLEKGLGKEATEIIVNYGFCQLKLHKIMLRVLADNPRAVESYKKAGFIQEGYFKDEVKLEGQYHDVIFMARFSE